MRNHLSSSFSVLARPVVGIGGAVLIALGAIAYAWSVHPVSPSGRFVAAVVEPITAAGGAGSDLSFQIAGRVSDIPVSIGEKVQTGATLISLDRSALLASRAGAAANLEAAQARLAALNAGTRPEQIAIDETNVAQTENALTSALATAYTNADDAIHTKADQLFTNPRSANPKLAVTVPDATLAARLESERLALEPIFSSWQGLSGDDLESEAQTAEADLKTFSAFLNDLTTALVEVGASGSIQAATLAGYETSVQAGRMNVLSGLSSLIAADSAYKGAVGALNLANAGATENDIDAGKAAVDAAAAALATVDVSLQESTITAPFSGTVTALSAALGQTVSPGQVLVSIEPFGGKKSDALVIPTSSIIRDNGTAFVYVAGAGATPAKRMITTGLESASGMTEVTTGLSAGDQVLMFGN